jgi:septum site-determining protein MinC
MMVAKFYPAIAEGWPHRLQLDPWQKGSCAVEKIDHCLGIDNPRGKVEIDCCDWPLNISIIRAIDRQLQQRGLSIEKILTTNPTTMVAANCIGVNCEKSKSPINLPMNTVEPLLIHKGTLRAGDHLEIEGSVLVLGDVNPGSRISATKHVMVWGRLRGIAHAGCTGNQAGKIIALQLRPLQLRIADAVARGPDDIPTEGFCEQAELINGEIRINPAEPNIPN